MKPLSRSKTVLFLLLLLANSLFAQLKEKGYDVVVYGGTSAGVIAAYTAKQMGKSVLMIEPTTHLGGLTTGGLGYTDIGNKYAIKGLSLDFYRKVGEHYGNFEQWIFEPHVAENIFLSYLKKANVELLYSFRIIAVRKSEGKILAIVLENSSSTNQRTNRTIAGKEFIDCSYEGDLMAKAGVSYTVGREDNSQYKETYNGVQFRDKHQFPDGIDPYKIPGKPESGLLWGINDGILLPNGTGNNMVQTYNIRVCLTKDPANRIPITRPEDYDARRYELLLRLIEKKAVKSINDFMKIDKMPGDKTDINNNGPFSTDLISKSWKYPEAGYAEREEIFKSHVNYTKGLFYFAGHDPRVPEAVRNEMLQYGYPKDEYINSNHFTTQMYVREARRMVGAYVMTQANCQGREIVEDGIGMAAYTMDSHNAERIVVNGMVKNEGDVQIGGFGPYPISYRSLIPKAAECSNLVVPVCLSASHIAYGSIRMEPVFMMLGQSAAVAACIAIDDHCTVQQVNVRHLQELLKTNPLADGSTPEILVDNDDPAQVTVSGNWKRKENFKGCYGPSTFMSDIGAKAGDFVRFAPDIKKSGSYNLYTYVSKISGSSSILNITVNDAVKKTDLSINIKDVVVKGQTEGEWVALGKFHFAAGNKGYAAIVVQNADSAALADVILFIPERN